MIRRIGWVAVIVGAIVSALLAPEPSIAASPLKFVVGFAAGSGVDAITRVVADRVQAMAGAPAIVVNRPGAGGRIAAEAVVHAEPDGSTILAAPIVTTAFTPFVFDKVGFDALKDLVPVTRLGNFKFALAVNVEVPVHTAQEFVAYVKANPGKTLYATPGPGTPAHFLGAMFNRATGTDLVHVPYAGSGPAAVALLSNQVQSAINTTVALLPLYQTQKIRLLAVTGEKRDLALPDVPTFAELGMNLGEMEKSEMWYGFFVPSGTSPATVQHLNQILVTALNDPGVREKLKILDVDPAPDTPEAFAKLVKADYDRWGPVIRSTGFKVGN